MMYLYMIVMSLNWLALSFRSVVDDCMTSHHHVLTTHVASGDEPLTLLSLHYTVISPVNCVLFVLVYSFHHVLTDTSTSLLLGTIAFVLIIQMRTQKERFDII